MNIIAQWRRWSITKQWNLATKSALNANVQWAIIKEIALIKKLNDAWITRVPQIQTVLENWFVYPWIEWEHFVTVYDATSDDIKLLLAQRLLTCAYQLDTLWVIHWELHRPTRNVLVWKDNTIYILDFERGSLEDYSWKNMKAVWQWMSRFWYVWIDYLKDLSWRQLEDIYQRLSSKIMGNTTVSSRYPSMWNLVIYSILLLLIDMLSKYFFYTLEWWASSIWLEPVLNYGSAWSLAIPHWITRLGAAWVIVRSFYEFLNRHISVISASLIIAGSLGNSIDRVVYGWVRDFIDITSLFSYPIFNLADCFLVIGVGLILYYNFFEIFSGKNQI